MKMPNVEMYLKEATVIFDFDPPAARLPVKVGKTTVQLLVQL